MSVDLPLISVILPVYNAEEYISEAIQSILNQSYSSFEIIVINDGSTDRTEDVVKSLNDNRIRYHKNEKNLKLISTLNLGLQLAKGKYIARLDADDLVLPNRFETQIHFLESHPDYGIVGTYAEEFGTSQSILEYVTEDEDIRYAFLTHNPFIHSSVMIRKSILTDFNLYFNPKWLHVEDYGLWISLLAHAKGKNIPEVLVKYRVHESQISFKFREIQQTNGRLLQVEYLQSLIPNNRFLDIILKLLNNEKNSDYELMLFLNEVNLNGFQKNRLEYKILSVALKKAKNQFLDSFQGGFKYVLVLFSIFHYFTLKQKIVLLTRIFILKK